MRCCTDPRRVLLVLLLALAAAPPASAQPVPREVDLAVYMLHWPFVGVGQTREVYIGVVNRGRGVAHGPTRLTLDLPLGLVVVGVDGPGWRVDDPAGRPFTATLTRTLPAGQDAPLVTLKVQADGRRTGVLPLTATVASPVPDSEPRDNTATTRMLVWGALGDITVTKDQRTVSDPFNGTLRPKAIPGALVEYAVEVANRGLRRADANSVVFVDPVPAGTALFVDDLPGNDGPVRFVDGAPSSGLHLQFVSLSAGNDDVQFSADGGLSWGYAPAPDADGCDAAVTHLRVTPSGRLRSGSNYAAASFTLEFRVRVR